MTKPNTSSNKANTGLENADLASVFAKLSATDKGLSTTEAADRLEKFGPNALSEKHVGNLQRLFG